MHTRMVRTRTAMTRTAMSKNELTALFSCILSIPSGCRIRVEAPLLRCFIDEPLSMIDVRCILCRTGHFFNIHYFSLVVSRVTQLPASLIYTFCNAHRTTYYHSNLTLSIDYIATQHKARHTTYYHSNLTLSIDYIATQHSLYSIITA